MHRSTWDGSDRFGKLQSSAFEQEGTKKTEKPFLHDRKAVEQQSPGSRSAPWVTVERNIGNPNGVEQPRNAMWNAFSVRVVAPLYPGCASATLGYVVSTPLGSADRDPVPFTGTFLMPPALAVVPDYCPLLKEMLMSRFRCLLVLVATVLLLVGCTQSENGQDTDRSPTAEPSAGDDAIEISQPADAAEGEEAAPVSDESTSVADETALTSEPVDTSAEPTDDLADWAPGIGARVRKDDQGRIVLIDFTDTAVADGDLKRLAGEEFLKSLKFTHCGIGDAGLEPLVSLPRLISLGLDLTKVSDGGLAQVAAMKRLEELYLTGTSVGDNGVQHLTSLSKLRRLRLSRTQITDVALKQLASCKTIDNLDVSETSVGDVGLASLEELPLLERLNLYTTNVSDAGLPSLRAMPKLVWLNLDNTKVTNAGLPELKSLTQLDFLHLGRTEISDAALDNLTTLVNLKTLHVTRTAVTADGAKILQDSLTECEVLFGDPDTQ